MDEQRRDTFRLGKRSPEEISKGRQNFTDELRDFHKLICGTEGKQFPIDDTVQIDEYGMTDEQLKEHFEGIDCLDTHSWQWMRNLQRTATTTDSEYKRRKGEEEELRVKVMSIFHPGKEKNVMS